MFTFYILDTSWSGIALCKSSLRGATSISHLTRDLTGPRNNEHFN